MNTLEAEPETTSTDWLPGYLASGFTIVRAALAEREVLELVQETDRVWSTPGILDNKDRIQTRALLDGGEIIERLEWPVLASSLYQALASDERILAPLREIFQQEPVLFKDKLIVRPPGAYGYGLHQDYPYWQEMGIPALDLLTVCLPFDVIDEHSGALTLYSGNRGQQLPAPENCPLDAREDSVDPASAETLRLLPGDLLFFHAGVPHCSGANRTNRDRRTLYLTYAPRSYGTDLYQQWRRIKGDL